MAVRIYNFYTLFVLTSNLVTDKTDSGSTDIMIYIHHHLTISSALRRQGHHIALISSSI